MLMIHKPGYMSLHSTIKSVLLLSTLLPPEKEAGTLRKVCRCTEMVAKAVGKLSLTCGNDQNEAQAQSPPIQNTTQSLSSLNGLSLELRGSTKSASHQRTRPSPPPAHILNESQHEQLKQASGDVTFATHALMTHVKSRVGVAGTEGKVKRMLPIPPGAVSGAGASKGGALQGQGGAGNGRKILRCHSAKARISRNLSLGDISTNRSTDI